MALMSLKEFGEWATKEKSVANPAPNNKYKGQCVSLIQQYLNKVFGMKFKARGNAKDWAVNIPEGFKKMSKSTKLAKGDILVYGTSYGKYGHVGMIDADGNYLDQNGLKALKVAKRSTPLKGYICILRSKKKIDIGVEEKVETVVTKTVKAVLGVNMRQGVGTKYKKICGIPYKKKVTVLKDSAGTANGYVWSKVKYNGKTGYVAKKYLK